MDINDMTTEQLSQEASELISKCRALRDALRWLSNSRADERVLILIMRDILERATTRLDCIHTYWLNVIADPLPPLIPKDEWDAGIRKRKNAWGNFTAPRPPQI